MLKNWHILLKRLLVEQGKIQETCWSQSINYYHWQMVLVLKSKRKSSSSVHGYFFIRTRGSFCSKFKNKLKAIPASVEEQSLKFLI